MAASSSTFFLMGLFSWFPGTFFLPALTQVKSGHDPLWPSDNGVWKILKWCGQGETRNQERRIEPSEDAVGGVLG